MARQPARRIDSIRIGDTRILTPGRRLARPRDLYHLALTLTWPRFFAALVFLFTLVNLVFGFLYWLSPGSVSNARGDSFLDHFFFSVETLATVGYGVMSPGSLYGHLVATSEILSGLVGIALITGLVFARFSKPTARILFSDRAVIRDFNGERVLMLRIANQRHSHRIVEATASMSLVRSEVSSDGEDFVAIHDLRLLRDRNPVFALTWTLVHAIDERSPLHGLESAQLAASQSRPGPRRHCWRGSFLWQSIDSRRIVAALEEPAMVFDVSVALTWLLFLALFPIAFIWLRRAWRIIVRRDYSEVALKRGLAPEKPEKFAPFTAVINLLGGIILAVVIVGVVLGQLEYSVWSAIAGSTIWMKLFADFILGRHAHPFAFGKKEKKA